MSDTKRSPSAPSGRFVLRIDSGLHRALRAAALAAGLSLNEYCARKLALPCGSVDEHGAEAVQRAASLFANTLVGVVVFGSWARGQEGMTSDVDLLIVLDHSIEIGRQLYRLWDEAPLYWDDYPVEPHFVHLPAPGARVSGLWAELSVDGMILFERGLTISRHLVQAREAIAAGRLIRRSVHGQTYWVKTEERQEAD